MCIGSIGNEGVGELAKVGEIGGNKGVGCGV